MRRLVWDTFACNRRKEPHRSHLMGFKIREIDTECKFSQSLMVEALAHAVPQHAISAALAHHDITTPRERKLSLALTVWLVIALHLYPTVSVAGVFRKLARGL